MKRALLIFFVFVLLALMLFYYTYPKWSSINEVKKLSQAPSEWKLIKLGTDRYQLHNLIDTPINGLSMWDVKGDVWIKNDKKGWFRLNIYFTPDTTVREYEILYYLGNEKNYKTFLLTHVK